MWLPTPSPIHVDEFKALVKLEFDIILTDEEALKYATDFLQIYFLLPYTDPKVRPQIVLQEKHVHASDAPDTEEASDNSGKEV